MSREEITELWISRIAAYRASGERAATWCERHQVTTKQLYYWMAKLKKVERQSEPTERSGWVAQSFVHVQ